MRRHCGLARLRPIAPIVSVRSLTPEFWNENAPECQEFIKKENNWQSIPLLNCMSLQNVKDLQFVRYRGMIQDMYNPEFYLKEYEVKNLTTGESAVRSGCFRDTIVCKEDEQFVEHSVSNVNSERQMWFCVPIPALNDWVSCLERRQSLKRPLPGESKNRTGPPPPKKGSSKGHMELGDGDNASPSSSACTEADVETCLVKIYDSDTSLYSLNDVVEVAGFLSLEASSPEGEEEDAMEVDASSRRPSKFSLHAVYCLSPQHCNPLLAHTIPKDGASSAGALEVVRRDLHLVLSQALLGDSLAADYLICHLLSSVYTRTELLPLGQFGLNLCTLPKGETYSKSLYNLLQSLVTKSLFFPMTLNNLNKKTFVPKKDYATNRLQPGLLQLSPGTHLVLDETRMEPGRLENTGVHNVSTLKRLVLDQKVAYDFEYYRLDYDTDVTVLVLSEGKSLLPCPVVLPLHADPACVSTVPEIFEAAEHFLVPELRDKIRVFLTTARCAAYTLSDAMQTIIQEGFVKMRRDHGWRTSAQDLHNLIVLARLMSLSLGQPELRQPVWERTLAMELQRKQRLHELPTVRG